MYETDPPDIVHTLADDMLMLITTASPEVETARGTYNGVPPTWDPTGAAVENDID